MADNVEITAGTGTTVATDDVAGVQYQRVKLDAGPDGASVPVTDEAPLPVLPGMGAHTISGRADLVGTSLVQLKDFGDPIPCRSVWVKSAKENASGALVYVGNGNMTVGTSPTGYELQPGEEHEFAASDAGELYAATLAGEEALVYWHANVLDPAGATWLDWQ